MFNPKYAISHKLLSNIKSINKLVLELNRKKFSKIVLHKMEKSAREISTFASTSIEGNPLPLTDVKQILKSTPQNLGSSEQEVINYNKALVNLNKKLSLRGHFSLTVESICTIQKQVTEKLVPIHESGKFRLKPVFVNDPKKNQTIYWPPDAKDIPILMSQLIEFIKIKKGNFDPLILAGLFHKQLVIIHPFMDGNGRTSRLATKVLLKDLGLDTFNLFSFENYYNRNVTNYFKSVGVIGNYYETRDSIDFTSWLEYFTDGIIDELLRVKKLLPEISVSPETKLMPYHEKMLEYIEKNGFITDREYAKLTDRGKSTRILDFKKLQNMGLIKRFGKGRSTYYK